MRRFFRKSNELRDAANVIADAIETAKDQEIAKVEEALAEARLEKTVSRLRLKTVLSAGKKLHDAIVTAGDDFNSTIEGMARDLNHDK